MRPGILSRHNQLRSKVRRSKALGRPPMTIGVAFPLLCLLGALLSYVHGRRTT